MYITDHIEYRRSGFREEHYNYPVVEDVTYVLLPAI